MHLVHASHLRVPIKVGNLKKCFESLAQQGRPLRVNAIADLGGGFVGKAAPLTEGHCPCIIKSRASSNGYFAMSRMRKLHLSEYFKLQGISPDRLRIPPVVSDRLLRGMIGNSFSVPVVASIIDRLLYPAGLTKCPIAFERGTGEDGEEYKP